MTLHHHHGSWPQLPGGRWPAARLNNSESSITAPRSQVTKSLVGKGAGCVAQAFDCSLMGRSRACIGSCCCISQYPYQRHPRKKTRSSGAQIGESCYCTRTSAHSRDRDCCTARAGSWQCPPLAAVLSVRCPDVMRIRFQSRPITRVVAPPPCRGATCELRSAAA